MAFNVDVPNRVDVKFYGRMNAQRIISTFSYTITEAAGPMDFDAFSNSFHAALVVAGGLQLDFLASVPNNYFMERTGIQVSNAVQRFYQKFYTYATLPGQLPQPSVAQNLAAVITRRGDVANRKNVSTLHVPAPTNSTYVSAGLLTQIYKDILATLATEVSNEVSGVVAGVGAWICSPCIPNGPLQGAVTPIEHVFVGDTVRVMRRRTVGLGE